MSLSLFSELLAPSQEDDQPKASLHPAELKKFYKPDGPIGRRKTYIKNCEISRLLALHPNSYQAYLRMPGQKNYRNPDNTVCRCAWYVAQLLQNSGWEFDGELQ
jgi:hypothetical protein